MLKKSGRFLGPLAEYGGICAWRISGEEGEEAPLQRNRCIEKASIAQTTKGGVYFPLDVP